MSEVRVIFDPKNGELIQIDPADFDLTIGAVRELDDGNLELTLRFSKKERCGKRAPPLPDGECATCELPTGHSGRHQQRPPDRQVLLSWADGEECTTVTV